MTQAARSIRCAARRTTVAAIVIVTLGGCAPPPSPPAPPLLPRTRAGATRQAAAATGSARPHAAPRGSGRPPARDAPPSAAVTLGGAAPTVVEAISPTGTWVSFCQARHDDDGDGALRVVVGPAGALSGDSLARFVTLATGEERAVEDVLASSRDGRWLVTREDGAARLVDARTGETTRLGADTRAEALSFREHRFLSFDGGSRRLSYVRTEGKTSSVVVLELESGREIVVQPGPGRLSRVRLDVTGEWVLLEVVAQDTNGNGRLDLPVRDAPTRARPCRGPIPTYAVFEARGDSPSARAAPVRPGTARDVPGLIAAFAQRLLVRRPGDELWLVDAQGRKTRFASGTCRGHLIHADVARDAALVACERTSGPDEGRNEVELWRGGARRALGVFVTGQAADAWPGPPTRLVALYPGREAALVDLERGTVHPLVEGDHVLGTSGARALVQRGPELVLVDVEQGATTPLATVPEAVPEVVRQPPMVAVGSVLVDVDRAVVVGTLAERPLGLTRTGEVLVALGNPGDDAEFATGPLAWRRP